jgi:hypothetical protein
MPLTIVKYIAIEDYQDDIGNGDYLDAAEFDELAAAKAYAKGNSKVTHLDAIKADGCRIYYWKIL